MRLARSAIGVALAAIATLLPLTGTSAQDAADPAASEGAAQEAESAIPPFIPTSAFASQLQLRGAKLAPDGMKFAFTVVRDETTYITIYDADTRELITGANLGDEQEFNWFDWAGNNRIIFSMTGRDPRDRFSFSRLYYLDLVEHQMHPLIGRTMEFDGDDVVHIDPAGEYVLVSFATSWREPPAVWRFDLGGDEPPRPYVVQPRQPNIGGWIADDTGVVRIALGASWTGNIRMRYRSNAAEEWDTVARTRLDDNDTIDLWDFMGLRAGSDMGFSIGVPEGGERRVLMEFDFTTGRPGEIVFQSPDEDVSRVTFDENNLPIAVSYAGDDFRREWLDPQIRSHQQMLRQALPDSWVTIRDITPDRSRMLVLQSGPADPGALYIFTPGERRLDLFAEMRPQVPSGLLAEPSALRYEARDGTSIHAYLTLPVGREPSGLPLVVYPHGGPFGIRDTDLYNDTVQLLANRGYAVIQPNFRGSGGYGETFELLGNGQIGRAMQDDLDDAVAYLVEQGTVDPSRVCIVGSSYGGFAAVWGAIRNPEIYRCAASFAGVMHFERQLSHDRDFLFGRNRGRHWDRVDGDQTNFDLDDVSPAVQVARLTRPVLLVHGEEDNRVPFNQFEMMVSRARSARVELETLSLPESGHGFASPEDEQAWYDALVDFLARHNPAD